MPRCRDGGECNRVRVTRSLSYRCHVGGAARSLLIVECAAFIAHIFPGTMLPPVVAERIVYAVVRGK